MTKTFHEIRFHVLRWRSRRAYIRFCNYADSFSCGMTLAMHLSGTLGDLERKYKALLERLIEADRARGGNPPCLNP